METMAREPHPAAATFKPPLKKDAVSSVHDYVSRWVEEFTRRHGRPPRVLHVGNVANNAYLNAKFLRRAGIDCDVLCNDYYHVMGAPEWEEADFVDGWEDDNAPRWWRVDLKGYRRPDWFVQGRLVNCLGYLDARAQGESRRATFYRYALAVDRLAICYPRTSRLLLRLSRSGATLPRTVVGGARWSVHAIYGLLRRVASLARRGVRRAAWTLVGRSRDLHLAARAKVPGVESERLRPGLASARCGRLQLWAPLGKPLDNAAGSFWRGLGMAYRNLRSGAARWPRKGKHEPRIEVMDRPEFLAALFARRFPGRPDQLTADEVRYFWSRALQKRRVFEHYDVVQCYAVEGIYPLISGYEPYVCYEHGTLRDFTLADNVISRLTSLAYREAGHSFITNGDCLDYADRLGVERRSAMIHPIDVDQHQALSVDAAAEKERLSADVLLFCPLRHDWKVKGTDVHIRALPLVKERLSGRRIKLWLAGWGPQVEESKQLLESLGCLDDVVWLRSMPRVELIRKLKAADVVLDQIALPHFGATAPQALAAGTPVVMSYKPSSTAWIVDEPAPILSAFDPEGVAEAVVLAMDPEWRAGFAQRARDWTMKYHHPSRIVTDHVRVYSQLLTNVEEAANERR